ncbi:DUF4214 domain-containing protein [Prochlorococcus sp. MIT 0916]|uniref:DUF4214 domain-containing protein n=1 Tax=Prochlorococcus sp. MIT 0916 TaxID=3082521 RepID=UPI0039B579F8
MYAQPEFKSAYGTLSTESQVNQIYKNLFDREADVTGLTYWTQQIKLGNLQLAEIAVHLVWAAQNNSGSADDKAALSNRTNAAVAYTAKIKESTSSILAFQPLDDGLAEGATFSAGSNITEARNYLAGIDKDTAHTAAGIAASVATINTNGVPSEGAVSVSKAFTKNLDNLVGTDADDAFDGVYYADGGTGTTAFPGDIVSGGAGTDTLTISVAGTSTVAQPINAITTTGVEKLYVTNYDANATTTEDTTVDTSLMSGLTTIGLTASNATGDTEFSGVAGIVATEMRNGAGDLTITYLADAVKGTADSATLDVSNLTAGIYTANGLETITINSSLTKSVMEQVVSDKLTKLVVTGDKDLEISTAVNFVDGTNSDTTIDSTVDASAFTGGLTVTAEAMDQSITTGSGADTINMVGTLTKYDTVSAGTGSDTLSLNPADFDTEFTNVSGVETVSINATADSTAISFKADKLSAGVETIVLDAYDHTDGSNEQEHTVSNQTTEKIILRHSTEDAADANDTDGNIYIVTPKTDTDADSITVEFEGVGNDTHTADTNYFGVDGLTLSNYETVNLISSVNTTVANLTGGGTTAKGDVKDNELDAFTSTTATSIVITGAADLTIGSNGGFTAAEVTSVDASALTGKLALTVGSEKATYTGGSKADTFTMAANFNNKDTVIGGEGKDTLTATITGLTVDDDDLKIQDVETIELKTTGANQIDASGITGASSVLGVTNYKQTITNYDLAQTISLGIAGDAADTSSEIDVTAKDATGTADTLKVKVENTQAATNSIIDASAIETLDLEVIHASNNATLDLTTFEGDNIKINEKSGVTGSGTLALGTLHKNTESVTSTYDGAVTVSFANSSLAATYVGEGTNVQNVTGTTKGDTITIGKTPGKIHVVSGGTGTDTVNLTANTGLVNVGSIDAENINIDVVAGTSQDITTSFGTGVDNVVITGGNSASVFTSGTIVDEVKKVDASAFLGQVDLTVAADKVDSTITLSAGSHAKDKLQYNMVGTGTDNLTSTGIEILDLNVDHASSTLNLALATGVTTIDIDTANSAVFVLDKLTGSELIQVTTAGSSSSVEAKLSNDAGSDDSISFELKGGTIDDTFSLITTDIETVNIKVTSDEKVTLTSAGAITEADLYSTLKLTGDKALTASATNADITTIDASGMGVGGSFTQQARSATTAVNYTGSTGNDTFIMMKAADVIDGGEKTGDTDLLDVNFTGVLGKISVDLSASGDQVTTFNGLADTTVQTGFEGVDLSGYTNYGSQVIGSDDKDVIDTVTGTASVDSVSLKKGADVYTVSAGKDVVDMGAGDDSVNITEANFILQTGTTTASTIDFGAGTDTLTKTSAGTGVDDNDFGNMSNVETLTLGAGGHTMTLGAKAKSAGIVTINGGTGADLVTLSAAGAITTLALGTGNDKITTTAAIAEAFSTSFTADFGGGTGDELILSNVTTGLADADFANITNLEKVTLAGNTVNTVTLSTNAKAAGVVSIVASGSGIDTLHLHDGITTIDTDGGNDEINIAAAAIAGASTAPTFDGGAGTDTITLTDATTALVDANFANTTVVEKLVLKANTANTVVLAANATTAGIVNILADGTGDDLVTLPAEVVTVDLDAGNDTITTTAAVAESLNSGNHTWDWGAGTDTLALSDVTTGLQDNDFHSQLTGLTNLVLAANTANTVVLGTDAKAAGLVSVTASGTGNDVLTLIDTITTMDLDAGNDSVSATTAIVAAFSTSGMSIDFGASGTDTLIVSDAGTTIADADFANITSLEAVTLADGGNTFVATTNANSAGLLTVTGGTGADLVTIPASVTTYFNKGGADVLTLPALTINASLTIDTESETTDFHVVMSAFQDIAAAWTLVNALSDVTEANEIFYASDVIHVWNETLETEAVTTIATAGILNIAARGGNVGHITLDLN